jgi:hypothetical protein
MAHWKHMAWLTLYIAAGLVIAGMISKVFNISTIVGKLGVSSTA